MGVNNLKCSLLKADKPRSIKTKPVPVFVPWKSEARLERERRSAKWDAIVESEWRGQR